MSRLCVFEEVLKEGRVTRVWKGGQKHIQQLIYCVERDIFLELRFACWGSKAARNGGCHGSFTGKEKFYWKGEILLEKKLEREILLERRKFTETEESTI